MAGIGSLANSTNSYTSSTTASATQSESESKASSKTATNGGSSPAIILTLSRQAATSAARRSLYAIASNSGGAFSGDEQNVAQSLMSQQQASAMGLDNPAAFTADPSAGYKAGVKFLDGVSAEEKSSDNWKLNRASSQAGYESNFRQRPSGPDCRQSQ